MPQMRKPPAEESMASYEEDFVAWLRQQAAALRNGRLDLLDRENIAEELESMARRDRRRLGSHLRVIMLHWLKLRFQPDKATRSWISSIQNSRDEVTDLLEDSPSLRREVAGLIRKEYRHARDDAAEETGLPVDCFPASPPFGADELLTASISSIELSGQPAARS